MPYNSNNPFSVCFNLMKMRYVDYDESLSSKDFLSPTDKVNVFINLETAYKNISMILDLERKIINQRDFDKIIISEILNLAGHYKKFFVNNGLDTKVYIYSTDFTSTEFHQFKYNEDYRSYYLNKFNDNPKIMLFTERMCDNIIPRVKVFCDFIPNVYFITAKNIEGSLVPYIISKMDPSRRNLIVGGEVYDTQYSTIPNFINHYFCRKNKVRAVASDVSSYIKILGNNLDNDELQIEKKMYSYYPLYTSLISVLGNKDRSIYKINGVGVKTLTKYIYTAIKEHLITDDTISPEMLGSIFHDEDMKDEFINNYYCSNIINMCDELSEAEIRSVYNQITDRLDINAIQRINNTKFYDHPIILEALL